eukprot:363292-Chlamydomonas_euryale.AAC.3
MQRTVACISTVLYVLVRPWYPVTNVLVLITATPTDMYCHARQHALCQEGGRRQVRATAGAFGSRCYSRRAVHRCLRAISGCSKTAFTAPVSGSV